MIAPSTDLHTFAETIRALAERPDHYYIKRPHIVQRISHNGRTFYSKFERIDTPLSDALIAEHLAHRITLALPLEEEGEASHIVFLYDGDAPEHFVHLFKHLMHLEGLKNFQIFTGKHDSARLMILSHPRASIQELHAHARHLSQRLESQTPKNWKLLPDPSLPESYNIVTVPYF